MPTLWVTSYQRDTFHIQIPQKLITETHTVDHGVRLEPSRRDAARRLTPKSGIRTINATRRLAATPKGFRSHAARMSPAQSAPTARVEPHNGHGCPVINLKGQRIGPLAMWSLSHSQRITITPQMSVVSRTANGTVHSQWITRALIGGSSSQEKRHVMLLNDSIGHQVPRNPQGK